MAILFPTLEDQETLVQFAMCSIGCSSEDVEILKTTCATLIADIKVISDFILRPFTLLSTGRRQSHFVSNAALLPIHYHHGGMPESYGFCLDYGPFASDLFYDTCDRFRPHEISLRSLGNRLQQGRDTLTRVNEKCNYAFTVVTVGKGGREASVKGETVGAGSNVHVQSVSVIALGSEKTCDSSDLGNHGAGEIGRSRRPVHLVFMIFMQTFDVFIQWVTNLVKILDGEGTIPLSGTYVLHDQKEKHNEQESVNVDNGEDMAKRTAVSLSCATDVKLESLSLRHETGTSSGSCCAASTASSRSQRSRTIRIRRYESHDVSSVFRSFGSQAIQFYLQEYTSHDPRLQCRLLLPAYYSTLRETIRDIHIEIDRLCKLEASVTRERSNDVTIVFSPTIYEFRHIQDSLRLYLSFCVTEDDLTAFRYYRTQYNKCVVEACDVMEMLKQLRRPSSYDMGANGAATTTKEWVPTPTERGTIQAGFESFWRVREWVLELHDSLIRDIEEKNRTHRYRVLAPPRSLPNAIASGAKKDGSFIHQTLSKVSVWTQFLTCGAELFDDASSRERDDEGFLLSTYSPLYESKAGLLRLVQRMVAAVETQAALLERDYPGTFYRDSRAKWAQRATGVMRYLESVSVVFSPPR